MRFLVALSKILLLGVPGLVHDFSVQTVSSLEPFAPVRAGEGPFVCEAKTCVAQEVVERIETKGGSSADTWM